MSELDGQEAIAIPAQPVEPETPPKRARSRSGTRKPRKTAEPRAPRAPSTPRAVPEHKRVADALDKLVPYLAIKDPYAAAVIRKRRVELAKALTQIPLLGDLVKWLSRMEATTDNPYVVLLTVALPIVAHHGLLPGAAGPVVGLASDMLGLAPSEAELAKVTGEAQSVVLGFGLLAAQMADVQGEAAAAAQADAA